MARALITIAIGCIVFAAAARSEPIGVVMMHGKTGSPHSLEALAGQINEAGFLTERPEMCWSGTRIYDRPYLECLEEADRAAVQLKARGATDIVILGMSIGGNAALAYGARRPGLKGIIALAPASPPDLLAERPAIAQSLSEAHGLIAAGKGNEKRSFPDFNNGRELTVTTTPAIYVTFFGKDAPGVMPINAAHLTAPLLMVSGIYDRTQRNADAIFAKAPANPLNSHVEVNSDHMGTPAASTENVVAWLKKLSH